VLAAGLFTVPSKVQRCTRTYTSYNVVSDTRRVHANNQCATLFHIFFVWLYRTVRTCTIATYKRALYVVQYLTSKLLPEVICMDGYVYVFIRVQLCTSYEASYALHNARLHLCSTRTRTCSLFWI